MIHAEEERENEELSKKAVVDDEISMSFNCLH